jgi:hypothetical protein
VKFGDSITVGRGGGGRGKVMRNGLMLFVAGAMISTLGVAQEPPTGSRLGSRYTGSIKYSEEQADDAATKMASCLVTKREAGARAYVAAYSADESDRQGAELFREVSCLSFMNIGGSGMSDTIQFSFPREILRGKFAEALLKKQSDAIAVLPALALAKDYSRPWFAASGRNPVIDEMGVCVADTNPNGVAGILATTAYSKEEATAFGAVMPNLGTCLRVGAKLQANRQALRAALADALYQRLTRPGLEAQVSEAQAAARQVRGSFRKFAECVVSKNAHDAHVYVVEDLPEAQFERLRNKMRDEACWRTATGLQTPVDTTGLKLQGTIAEALMATQAEEGPLPLNSIAPLKQDTISEENRRKDSATVKAIEDMLALFWAGECVVRADQNGSQALLKSGLASPQESSALAALKPVFDGCSKHEFGYTVTPDELRAAVAVNYYRLAHAPRVGTASSGAKP